MCLFLLSRDLLEIEGKGPEALQAVRDGACYNKPKASPECPSPVEHALVLSLARSHRVHVQSSPPSKSQQEDCCEETGRMMMCLTNGFNAKNIQRSPRPNSS